MRIDSSRVTRAFWGSIASFLLLITPFVSYVQYQRYGSTHPEVLITMLLLAVLALILGMGAGLSPAFGIVTIAALLTFVGDMQLREPGLKKLGVIFLVLTALLWLVRQHAARVVSLMMATVFLLSLLSPASAVSTETAPIEPLPRAQSSDLPLVVHLVLDEHIGVEGLPEDLAPSGFKHELQSFFIDRGFRLFGKAYSEYPNTLLSVSHLLNLSPGGYVPDLLGPGPTRGTYRLTRNAYFQHLAGLGYQIRVHEADYLYVCPDGIPAACRAHPTRSLNILNRLAMPVSAKLSIVAGTFFLQSEAYSRVKDKYRAVRLRLLNAKISLPRWNWERGIAAPAATLPVVDAVAADLSKAGRGTFLYAHLLLPHYPYVYDAGCRPRPESEWLERSDPDDADTAHGFTNLPAGRAARYALYFQQVLCTQRKIDQLLDAIPGPLRRDAIVVIQGDHGSRISLVDPTTVATVSPAVSDYADHFSALFAVRSPSIDPGYDLRLTPITCLLRTLVGSDFRSIDGTDACSTPHLAFFFGTDVPQPRPLPDFAVKPGDQP